MQDFLQDACEMDMMTWAEHNDNILPLYSCVMQYAVDCDSVVEHE